MVNTYTVLDYILAYQLPKGIFLNSFCKKNRIQSMNLPILFRRPEIESKAKLRLTT